MSKKKITNRVETAFKWIFKIIAWCSVPLLPFVVLAYMLLLAGINAITSFRESISLNEYDAKKNKLQRSHDYWISVLNFLKDYALTLFKV